jgi:hypothetical protein
LLHPERDKPDYHVEQAPTGNARFAPEFCTLYVPESLGPASACISLEFRPCQQASFRPVLPTPITGIAGKLAVGSMLLPQRHLSKLNTVLVALLCTLRSRLRR